MKFLKAFFYSLRISVFSKRLSVSFWINEDGSVEVAASEFILGENESSREGWWQRRIDATVKKGSQPIY